MTALPGTTTREKLILNSVRDGDCLRWQGAHISTGYGYLADGGKSCRVHRLAYELFVGPIPDGLVLDHLCRVRDCVNPHHLEAVTQAENLRRREVQPVTHCPNGHEFSEENTRILSNGWRQCRSCRAATKRRAVARVRQRLTEDPGSFKHGTPYTYSCGCRCASCRASSAESQRRQRSRKNRTEEVAAMSYAEGWD